MTHNLEQGQGPQKQPIVLGGNNLHLLFCPFVRCDLLSLPSGVDCQFRGGLVDRRHFFTRELEAEQTTAN